MMVLHTHWCTLRMFQRITLAAWLNAKCRQSKLYIIQTRPILKGALCSCSKYTASIAHQLTKVVHSTWLHWRNQREMVWFGTTPIGHNTLSKTVKRLCDSAGIGGFKTNHSLRVTSATRLFQSGVDEQLIMGRTGHRSIAWWHTHIQEGFQWAERRHFTCPQLRYKWWQYLTTNKENETGARPSRKPRPHQFTHSICSKWTSSHQLDGMLLHYYKLHKVTPAYIPTLFTLYIPHFIYTVHTF